MRLLFSVWPALPVSVVVVEDDPSRFIATAILVLVIVVAGIIYRIYIALRVGWGMANATFGT